MSLPSAVFITAANQEPLAAALVSAEAGWILPSKQFEDVLYDILSSLNNSPMKYIKYAGNAASLCDGQGAGRVCRILPR